MSASAPLVDSHCHLAFGAFEEDRDVVVERARGAGLVACLVVAVDSSSARGALALAQRHPGWAHASAGIHPTEALVGDDSEFDRVSEQLRSGAFVAVGETGLDAHHDCAPLAVQRRSLDRHLRLALDLGLPVILHCRDAFPEMAEALRPYGEAGLRGVLHCFTGRASDIDPLLAAGLHIGVGGIATFKPRHDLREAVRAVPDDRLVLETDAPWLAPQPVRGRRNEPAFVAHVARCLAQDRGVPFETLATLTTANADALFRLGLAIPPPG